MPAPRQTGPPFSGPLGNLARFRQGSLAQASSFDRTGGNADYISIAPGERAVLADLKGPGCLRRLWMTVSSADPYVLRNTVLRMYWDGEENPSVLCPLGDFFGVGFSLYRHYISLPMSMTSGGYNCYFPMPFSEGARVEVENQGEKKIQAFYFNLTWEKHAAPEKDTARFHALWRRDTTQAGENYLVLDAHGRGHLVGCVMNMQGQRPFDFWFLEGDEMIYVDDEPHPPAIHGTGTEDYFNSGWYFINGRFAAPWHGLTVQEFLRPRISAYRFHVEDPVPFQKRLRFTLEHGGTNDRPGLDYSSVAYWYQAEPHHPHAELPPAADRLPQDQPLERAARQAVGAVMEAGFWLNDRFRLMGG